MWRNGRRDGLKIRSGQLGVGSNPTIGTNFKAKYTYNASGIRTSKAINVNMLECNCGKENCDCNGTFTTTFFLNGNKIIKQHDCCNDLTFYYAADGITGFHLKNNVVDADFYYKKNAQNDIIGIYSTSGDEIVRYEYDAWGNCIVKYLQDDGTYGIITSDYSYNDTSIINRFIAFKNPFRYRSYYYDFETNLYYLNSRYYDPELGRFINADDVTTLDITQIALNGLNLYAYCLNNPVNQTDDDGNMPWWLKLLLGLAFIVVGALITAVTAGAGTGFWAAFGSALLTSTIQAGISTAISAGIGFLVGGISSVLNNGSFWDGAWNGLLSGAVDGFMWGGIFSGGAQILSGGFKGLAKLGVATGKNGGLFKSGILSPNRLKTTKEIASIAAKGQKFYDYGGTIFKFGKYLRIDVSTKSFLHLHILGIYKHIPLGVIISGILGGVYAKS